MSNPTTFEWKIVDKIVGHAKTDKTGPKGFDPLTTGLEVQHSIHAELQAQELGTGLPY